MSPTAQNSASASASVSGRLRGGPRKAERRVTVVTQELVEEERARLIEERQGEVHRVLDRHDDLIRESFHLEKFVSLVGYDPKVAKQDKSEVFLEYKARHDLVEDLSAGPSRATRRAHIERLKSLNTPTVAPAKRKGKAKDVGRPPADHHAKPLEVLTSVPRDTKGKGKARAHSNLVTAITAPPAINQRRGRSKSTVEASDSMASTAAGPSSLSSTPTPRMRKRPDMPPPPDPPPPKRRRTEHAAHGSERTSGSERRASLRSRNVVEDEAEDDRASTASLEYEIPDVSPDLDPLPRFPSLKRIKLIVRPPIPKFTHPLQRPPPHRFGESVSTYLGSYVELDGRALDEATLGLQAKKDAEEWREIDRLRAQGRLLHPPDADGALFGARTLGGKRKEDAWDAVVHAVEQQSASASAYGGKEEVARQVAVRVMAYWEARRVRDAKARAQQEAQEEKRVRVQAKQLARLVEKEWKKVVLHIREQERLQREAEERRRGHEHLDAILDQSGQILEAQHMDLTRDAALSLSRSRSRSISSSLQQWDAASGGGSDEEGGGDSDDEDEGEGEGQEQEKESSSDDEEEGGGQHDLTSSMLFSVSEEKDKQATNGLTNGGHGPEAMTIRSPKTQPLETDSSRASSPTSSISLPAPAPSVLETLSAIKAPLGGSYRSLFDDDSHSTTFDPPHFAFEREREHQAEKSAMHVEDPFAAVGDMESSSPLLTFETRYPDDPPRTPSDFFEDEPVERVGMGNGNGKGKRARTVSFADEPGFIFGYDGGKEQEDEDGSMRALLGGGMLGPSNAGQDAVRVHTNGAAPTISAYPFTQGVGQDKHEEEMRDQDMTPLSIPNGEAEIPTAIEAGTPLVDNEGDEEEEEDDEDAATPAYLRPYAIAPVEWDPSARVIPPLLLRGTLRPYQQAGLEWLASLHSGNLNGILADEMGLGKTIQTIALLAHLACDRGIWGPHLIIVPTSVLLNWEMEFKKFLPGFKILSYHGNTKRRKELRQGWNNKYHFNVCVTSYTLASRDAHVFKRKPWYYMILDEAHMIKNFKSQRWNTLLMFRSFRRLLLTGTPLQNNLTELWALLQFLMSGTDFANLKEFGEWFANPLEKAIEMGSVLDDEAQQSVAKLHQVLRPYLLRRLKRDVEKELPSKFEHLVMCPLSKRQRFLYDEFMARAETRTDLSSGVYHKIANILMQLRKVVNHPDLFEVRPIRTSFAMTKSAVADFEIKELLVRRELLREHDEDHVDIEFMGLQFVTQQPSSFGTVFSTRMLDGTTRLPLIAELPGEPPPRDTRTIAGYRRYKAYMDHTASMARWEHIRYTNSMRCNRALPVYAVETIETVKQLYKPLLPLSAVDERFGFMDRVNRVHAAVKSNATRVEEMTETLNRFAFVTPSVVARDVARIALAGHEDTVVEMARDTAFDASLHGISVKLQIAFPDPSLLQYDCGKLQRLAELLRERKAGGHRILIFTQMTRILDILEIFLNFHGYLYLRLDGATKIEDRQYITERFNTDARIFCFISSSRSGGVGINLTGADTVVFYDSDFNPQMDKQCEDRAHRIGQIRDVHIYRFVSQHTVEEALLRKANQKRSLDDIVIQRGEFDWRSLFGDESALTKALGEFEDTEDAHAAEVAAREEVDLVGADEADFGTTEPSTPTVPEPGAAQPHEDVEDEDREPTQEPVDVELQPKDGEVEPAEDVGEEEEEEEGGTVVDYMLAWVREDATHFSTF